MASFRADWLDNSEVRLFSRIWFTSWFTEEMFTPLP